ncbi:BamA/TamA family outer membrane protein [Celeribacter ethanolicus]|uniref:BamA/TamA family outer membrane protein n=1 Tax=Celeribacter ethanolicus TaxID=1758178 RepID=UPI000829DACF|nr:BamA/TamA family outer membrane protein [Celeribacter ethanolicus]
MLQFKQGLRFGRPGSFGALATCCAVLSGTVLSGLPAWSNVAQVVEVRGAEFIPADDIQATCGVEAGVAYSALELRAIEGCLMSTGVFETVRLYTEAQTLVIEVQELNTRPGKIEAMLAYDSQDGLLGSLAFEQYNFLPKTFATLSLDYNDEVERISGALYRADAFDAHTDLGLRFSAMRREYDDVSYTQEQILGEVFVAWTPSDALRIETGIGYRDYRLFDVEAGASALLVQEETDSISEPFLHMSLSYGEPIFGGQGAYRLRLDQYLWNYGSDERLFDTRVQANATLPLADGLSLLVGLNGGKVHGLDDNDTRGIDRYFPGANTFRGFAPRGIGPRDSGDALGGNQFFVGSLELQQEFGDVWNAPLRGGVFLDSGAAWGLDNTLSGGIDDGWHRRTSVGLTLTLDVGNTPVSLYLAKPLEQEDGDETQAFGFSISTRF